MALMKYFIGSFEYRVAFLVKIRRFNGHRKWTFCILGSWAVVLGRSFRQIVSIRVMTLIDTDVVASRHIKREEVLLPAAVRRSKPPELIRGNENVTHSFLGETTFLGGIFCLEYPSRRRLQIVISQTADFHFALTADFHFANYRFSFRFVSLHFVSQTTERKIVEDRCWLAS